MIADSTSVEASWAYCARDISNTAAAILIMIRLIQIAFHPEEVADTCHNEDQEVGAH